MSKDKEKEVRKGLISALFRKGLGKGKKQDEKLKDKKLVEKINFGGKFRDK